MLTCILTPKVLLLESCREKRSNLSLCDCFIPRRKDTLHLIMPTYLVNYVCEYTEQGKVQKQLKVIWGTFLISSKFCSKVLI